MISTSLNARIFSSLQKEIDLAYAPLPEEHYEAEPVAINKPSRIVEEIKQLKESGSELVDVLRKREERALIFPSGLKRPVDAPRTTTAPGFPPAPRSPMSIDFEKPAAPPGPKFDFTQPVPMPTPPAKFSDGIPERATGDQGSPPPSGFGGSEPMMIHKESKITPSVPMRSFHLEMPEDKMRERGSLMSEERQPAKLDIGGMRKTPEGPAKTEVVAPRVVHYGVGQDSNKAPFGAPIPSFEKSSPIGTKPLPTSFPIIKEEPKIKDALPITEPKSEKPGWLNKILHKSEPESFLTKNDKQTMPRKFTTKQVNYSTESGNIPKSTSPEPKLAKKIDAIKSPENYGPGQAMRNLGAPPPNLPVSPKSGEEVIDLDSLKKIQR